MPHPLHGSGDLGQTKRVKEDRQTHRKAGIRWTGLSDGEAAASQKLRVCVRCLNGCKQLDKEEELLQTERQGG